MADQNEAKTKTIGFLPIEKVQTLNGWDEYADKSTKLSVLRTETQKAKNSVRDALKDRLNENDAIDFVVEGDWPAPGLDDALVKRILPAARTP